MTQIKIDHGSGSSEIEEVFLSGGDDSVTLKSDDPKLNFTGFSILDGSSTGFTVDADGTSMVVTEKRARAGRTRYKVRYAYEGEFFEKDGRISRGSATDTSPKGGDEGGG